MRKKAAYIFLLIFSLMYVSFVLYIQSYAFSDNIKPTDVLLVLGTRPNENSPNPCLVARVKHAAYLHSQGFAPKLLFSGGKLGTDAESEAEVMKEIVLTFGIQEDSILLEPESTSTYENLVYSSKILNDESLHSVIIVSDAYHLPRIALIAKKLGMDFSVSPAKDSPCTTQLHNRILYFIQEPLKIAYYKLTGKL